MGRPRRSRTGSRGGHSQYANHRCRVCGRPRGPDNLAALSRQTGQRLQGRPGRAVAGVVVWWSAFTAFTAFTWSATSMAVCLFLFGMGEAGAFPIATRSLSRWILPAERGFAQGATHAGSRLGGALTPVLAVALI